MTTKTDMTVANTILAQIGGNRFIAMTGAHNLSADNKMLQFNIKAKNKAKCNGMKIELVNDTYTVTFWKISPFKLNKKTMEMTGGFEVLKTVEDVYCEVLQDVFTDFTGLYTRL